MVALVTEVDAAAVDVGIAVLMAAVMLVGSPGPRVTRAVIVVEGRVMIWVKTGFCRGARARASGSGLSAAARWGWKRRSWLRLMIAITAGYVRMVRV